MMTTTGRTRAPSGEMTCRSSKRLQISRSGGSTSKRRNAARRPKGTRQLRSKSGPGNHARPTTGGQKGMKECIDRQGKYTLVRYRTPEGRTRHALEEDG